MTNNPTQEYVRLSQEAKKMRAEITNSDAYLDLQETIEGLEDKINEMKEHQEGLLKDALQKEEAAGVILSELLESGEYDDSLVSPTYKNSNHVDVYKFYNVIDDFDEFMARISITQKVVKDYAKERKELKDVALSCIIEDEPKLIGFTIN